MKPPFKGLPDCSKIFLYFFFHLNALFKECYNCKAKFKKNEEKNSDNNKMFLIPASFISLGSL